MSLESPDQTANGALLTGRAQESVAEETDPSDTKLRTSSRSSSTSDLHPVAIRGSLGSKDTHAVQALNTLLTSTNGSFESSDILLELH
ncbi:unnamed protein product [Gongylonema pulchrum]|uniref:E3 ubiquitin-protein ligase MARCH7 n=1 Tax=Gongylonema pulchrum TaxID=637853 RepID=A0A183D206_9BILA|nr:unnamed protein product [Gongylonema pulchrum]